MSILYINLIKKYIKSNENITLLSGIDENHEFIKLLDNYNIIKFDKKQFIEKFNYKGNEINAIIDLIIGQKTKKLFIGCHNLELNRGSSFSYTIYQKLSKNILTILIDLDNIT